MGQITVSVNRNTYSLACRDGEEDRLRALVAQVDQAARDLSGKLGQVGEARLMLMVSLLLADELNEAKAGGEATEDAAAILDEAAVQLEGIAERLSGS